MERRTFTYDGKNSADFGLYIAGDSVYDAPARDMDMITIPGRNGQLSIDQGRFENITVTYPAFIWADTQEEFRTKVRAIRNWLTSKHSYYKLTDNYNPESYRLGIYKSGLEVEPIFYNRAGRFELSFDCKPQRFLFSGEEVFTLGEWGETTTYSGSIASFDGTETTAIKSLKVNITPKQSGSGEPSPSNVRAISGWDEVNTIKTGRNFFDADTWLAGGQTAWTKNGENDYIFTKHGTGTADRISNRGKFKVLAGEYYLSFKSEKHTSDISVRLYSNGAYGLGMALSYSNGYYYRKLTAPEGTTGIQIYFANNTTGVGESISVSNVQIERNSIRTTYEPYQGEAITTNLPQTVYGGVLDVVSGKLTLTKGFVDLGSLNWVNSGGYFTAEVTLNYSGSSQWTVPDGLCDRFKIVAMYYVTNASYRVDKSISWYPNLIRVADNSYTDATAFKNALNGAQMVYTFATPTEIQLTPTQVTTLLGNNNIWADAGTIEVEVGENPNILVNPTPFESCPVFEVEGSGTLTVNNSSMTIANNGTTIIDSEMMEAYEEENEAIISRNDMVSGEFPTLESGNNSIGTVGLTSVKVTPRWWEV